MDEAFDPYRKWLGIPPGEQPPNHYRLLGLALFESDPEVIAHAADARMAHLKTFQTGRYAELSQRVLNHLAAAKVCLLKPENKEEYDRQLRAELESRQQAAPAAFRPPPPPPAPPEVEPTPASFAAIPEVRSKRKTSVAAYLRRRRKQSRLAVLALVLLVGILAGALAFVLTRPQELPPGPPPEPQPGPVKITEAV